MFERIIKSLSRNRNSYDVLKAGSRALEAILHSKGLDNPQNAIEIALQEFSRYADHYALQEFDKILRREFAQINGARSIKAKARALKELWDAEVKALMSPPKRTKIVGIRLSEEEYEIIQKEASKLNMSISEYIRKQLGFE